METVNDLVDALSGGLSQHGRLLKLDTLPGKNILLSHRLVTEDKLGRWCDRTEGEGYLRYRRAYLGDNTRLNKSLLNVS